MPPAHSVAVPGADASLAPLTCLAAAAVSCLQVTFKIALLNFHGRVCVEQASGCAWFAPTAGRGVRMPCIRDASGQAISWEGLWGQQSQFLDNSGRAHVRVLMNAAMG